MEKEGRIEVRTEEENRNSYRLTALGEDGPFADDVGMPEMLSHIIRARMMLVLVILLACVLPNCVRAARGGGWGCRALPSLCCFSFC